MGGLPLDQVATAPAEAPADEFASLEAIAQHAEALETGTTTQQQEAAAKRQEAEAAQAANELQTMAAELFSALEMLRMMAAPLLDWWDMFGRVWSDQQLQAIAQAGAAVMQRHGWTMGELFSQWGPYLALVGATLPPSLVTYQAIKARQDEAKRPPAVARPEPHQPAPVVQDRPQEGVRL